MRIKTQNDTRAHKRPGVRTARFVNAESFRNFSDLAKHWRRGRDFNTVISPRPASNIAVIVPHGGGIEVGTSEIGRAIAGADFNFYAFEGMRDKDNYETLHLTSHRFDDPDCVALLSTCSVVVAIHGCKGKSDKVFLGGRDLKLKDQLAFSLTEAGICVAEEPLFPAKHPNNICNRGKSQKGVQLEISGSLRHSPFRATLIRAMRAELKRVDATGET